MMEWREGDFTLVINHTGQGWWRVEAQVAYKRRLFLAECSSRLLRSITEMACEAIADAAGEAAQANPPDL